MRYFLIGAASVALAATGALAGPGDNHGNKGNGGGHAAAKVEAKGKAKVDQRGSARAETRVKADNRLAARDDDKDRRGPAAKAAVKADSRQAVRIDTRKDERGDRDDRGDYKPRDGERGERDDRRDEDRWERDDRRDGDYARRDVRFVDRDVFYRDREVFRNDARRAYLDGCPPGLAKKHNGCMPPGLAKRDDDRRYFRYDWQPRLFGLRNYERGSYFYRDGYLLRMSGGDRISGYIPLLGGALAIGNPWPTAYRSYALPQYYVDYYDLGPADNYRYADNVIYRVNAEDAAIMSVAALLTGDQFQIGQAMPMGYDVYNVPYAYRDRYYDTPEAMYRYSDGYVYRIDPKTQLIAAAINLLV